LHYTSYKWTINFVPFSVHLHFIDRFQ